MATPTRVNGLEGRVRPFYFLASLAASLDILARLLDLLSDAFDRLVDFLAGAFRRTFLFLAGG